MGASIALQRSSRAIKYVTGEHITPETRPRCDAAVAAAAARRDAAAAAAQDVVARGGDWTKDEQAELKRLLALAARDRVAPSALWRRIVDQTAEIIETAEAGRPAFIRALAFLVKGAATKKPGTKSVVVEVAAIKSPTRIHEKAVDDYRYRFDDGTPPEACVMDVLRARVVFGSPDGLVQLVSTVAGAPSVDVGQGAKLRVLRCKNKFGTLDPTHFRNVLFNFELVDGRATKGCGRVSHVREAPYLRSPWHSGFTSW